MKFGIEIETILLNGITRRELAAKIRAAGVTAYDAGYSHATVDHWKLVYDVSVTGGRAYSCEIVSPILYDQDGLDQLKTVLDAIKDDTRVDQTCGVHVHHDLNGMDIKDLRILSKMYVKFEGAFDSIMPISRRGGNNIYCRSMIGSDGYEGTMRRIGRCNSITDLMGLTNHSRYVKLNLHSIAVHGTVEFRQHSGTTDFEKLDAWVKLTFDMMERSKIRSSVLMRGRDNFAMLVNNMDRATKRFLKSRRAAFAS